MSESAPVPMHRIGGEDEFGEVVTVDYLKERFGLTLANIVKQAELVLQRK